MLRDAQAAPRKGTAMFRKSQLVEWSDGWHMHLSASIVAMDLTLIHLDGRRSQRVMPMGLSTADQCKVAARMVETMFPADPFPEGKDATTAVRWYESPAGERWHDILNCISLMG